MTLFNLNYLLKTLSPNIVILRIRVLTYEFGRNTIQSIAGLLNNYWYPRALILFQYLCALLSFSLSFLSAYCIYTCVCVKYMFMCVYISDHFFVIVS